MKRLLTFSIRERHLAVLLREFLEKEGIASLIRNEQLFGAMGEIPFAECFPELWVVDDETFPRARMLAEGWLHQDARQAEPWTCPACGEELEGQFGACWKCGRQRE